MPEERIGDNEQRTRRRKSAQLQRVNLWGLRRQTTISCVAPPRRTGVPCTPSSSLLVSGRLALATRFARGLGTDSTIVTRRRSLNKVTKNARTSGSCGRLLR